MIRSNRIEDSFAFYCLLFLSCLNINEMGSILFIVFCLYSIVKCHFVLLIDKTNYILTMVMCVICMAVSFVTWGLNDAIKCLNFLGAYVVGYSAFINAHDKQKLIKNSMFSVFSGFALQIVLVYLYNLYCGQPSTRTLYAIWNNGLISVTLIALLSSVVIGYSFYGIAVNKKKSLKIFVIIALYLTALANITTATRTPFLLAAFMLLILICAYIKNSDKSVKIRTIVISIIVISLAAFCYIFDWLGVRSFLLNSALYERFSDEGLQTGRIRIAKQFMSYMWRYPFGGGLARKEIHNYAHNILLEIYDMYGALPFLLTVIFYIQSIKNTIAVIKHGQDTNCNYIFAGLYITILVQMFLEPVIEGFPILFYVFLFIHGICTAYVRSGLSGKYEYEIS